MNDYKSRIYARIHPPYVVEALNIQPYTYCLNFWKQKEVYSLDMRCYRKTGGT